jgi:hypothetical protein
MKFILSPTCHDHALGTFSSLGADHVDDDLLNLAGGHQRHEQQNKTFGVVLVSHVSFNIESRM